MAKLIDLGFKQTGGKDAKGCIHMAEWFPTFTLLVLDRTGFDMSKLVVQAAGGSSLSAGTHAEGTAMDYRIWNMSDAVIEEIVEISREAGARATWLRRGKGWENNAHIHSALDCPCKSGADYQLARADNGEDGLKGRGKDIHPKPKTKRNWQSGIKWMNEQLKEVEMAIDGKEIAEIILRYPAKANGKTQPLIQHFVEMVVTIQALAVAAGAEKRKDSESMQKLMVEFKKTNALIEKLVEGK